MLALRFAAWLRKSSVLTRTLLFVVVALLYSGTTCARVNVSNTQKEAANYRVGSTMVIRPANMYVKEAVCWLTTAARPESRNPNDSCNYATISHSIMSCLFASTSENVSQATS